MATSFGLSGHHQAISQKIKMLLINININVNMVPHKFCTKCTVTFVVFVKWPDDGHYGRN